MIYRERFHLAVPCSRFRLLADGANTTLPFVEFGILRVAYAELPLTFPCHQNFPVFLPVAKLIISQLHNSVWVFLCPLTRTTVDFPDLLRVRTTICCRAIPVFLAATFI